MLLKKRLVVLALLMASSGGYTLFTTPTSAQSKACKSWEITATINIRESPSTSAKIISTLSQGGVIEIERWSRDGKWGFITSQQGDGWLSADYLKCID